jgi:hypothetical protein
MAAGYSKTPLAKKLGIKPGFNIMLVNAPAYYLDLFTDMPENIHVNIGMKKDYDFVHFFTKDAHELARMLPKLRKEIVENGMIWVSWPKKSAKIACDITEQEVRDTALKNDLVDIKVCAVDEIWSGLKLVIPLKSR